MSSSEIDALSRSLSSLPSSPLSSTYSNSAQYTLSSSMASMTLSGNGVKSTTGSQCSSKSHSPAGSITSTLTLTGRQDELTTPNSGSDCGDLREDKQVNFKVKFGFGFGFRTILIFFAEARTYSNSRSGSFKRQSL